MRKVWRCHVCGAYNSCVVEWCWICHELRDPSQKFISHYEQKNIVFIPGGVDKKEKRGEKAMAWDKVGSARLSKSGEQVVLVIDKIRYVVGVQHILLVLNKDQDYATISKCPTDATPSPGPGV